MRDADELAELEEERRFLLRSLTDLERERVAGDVDDTDFAVLHDGYTARAAAVLRSLEDGRAALAPPRPRRRGRVVGWTLGVVVVGIVLGVLVARFASPRGSGDTITGGNPADQVSALLGSGREQMGRAEFAGAIAAYRAVLEIEPENVEANTYLGWVLAQASTQQSPENRALTLETGKQQLRTAIAADPSYADPRCFLAMIAALIDADVSAAATRRHECLDSQPSSEMQLLMAEFVDPVLAAETAAPSTVPLPAAADESVTTVGAGG